MKKKKQRIYSEEFKWKVVQDVLSGKYNKEDARRIYGIGSKCAILYWMRQFSGISDYRDGGIPIQGKKLLEEMKELGQSEKRIKELEQALERERLRADLWQKIVELAGNEINVDLIKKYGAKLSTTSKSKKAKK